MAPATSHEIYRRRQLDEGSGSSDEFAARLELIAKWRHIHYLHERGILDRASTVKYLLDQR